jgi:hypothetical protein
VETYKVEMEILCVGSLVEVVIVILFEIHFTRMMRSLCRGSPFVVYVWSTFNVLSISVILLSLRICLGSYVVCKFIGVLCLVWLISFMQNVQIFSNFLCSLMVSFVEGEGVLTLITFFI